MEAAGTSAGLFMSTENHCPYVTKSAASFYEELHSGTRLHGKYKREFFLIYIIFTLLLYTANKNCMNKDVLTLVKCKVLYLTVNRRMVQKGGRSGKSWSVISGCCCSATRQREVRSFYHCSPCKCCITQEQSPSFYSNSTNSKLAA